jgi:cytidylate kinase
MSKIFESFNEFLVNEGVYDKGIFKTVFLAGGPGAGKSYVAGKTTEGHGLKTVNSDDIYELMLKAQGISMDLNNLTDEDFKKSQEIRKKAKSLTNKKLDVYLQGRLGLVIDGTGKDFGKISKTAKSLQDIGYDTYMIFVNTSLDVAKQRNNMRDRKVPEDMVIKFWNEVQNNMGKFQNFFGASNFLLVDNNNATEDVFNKVFKKVMKFVNSPIKNWQAKNWIEQELNVKRK